MEFRPPSYNRYVAYSIAAFYDHSLQSIMALFIAKTPKLGAELMSVSMDCRQDRFFHGFRKFADAYVNLSLDDDIYFSSTSKEKAGTQGGGARSGKFFAEKDKRQQSYHAEKIKYFEQKFKSSITGEKDERLFLGVRQIWNRIAIERDELLAPYMSSIASAYDDDSFSTPIPDKLDRYLVPLKLRNKVFQKWSNRRRIVPVTSREYEESDEMEPECKRKEPELFTIQPVLLGDEDW
jgi:hypothetical protein